MRITVVGRHFDVTEPIKRYADKKLLKLDRYTDKIKEAHVILEVQKFRRIAEITLFMKYFKLTAKEESRDMYASIDKTLDSLHKQVLKVRERIKEHKARRKGSAKKAFLDLQNIPDEIEIASRDKKSKVIRKQFQSKPMSVEEACMELDLFKKQFLVFRNSKTENITVVYKRDDGNYGLIAAR